MKLYYTSKGFNGLKASEYVWLFLLVIAVLMFFPWLSDILFNTKGEPREAIVAMSMLNTGNWILPVNFGTDIPYKPPFLAWCIALCSLISGGISEVTSRIPSVIATIALTLGFYGWLRGNGRDKLTAFLSGLVFITNIEVWRAATACRVDMVLTACMVGAMFILYRFIADGCRSLPWIAVILMTCAMLTKGPIGIFLPCLVTWLFAMTKRRDVFLKATWKLAVSAVLSLVIPALWYWMAYREGGERFLELAMEENLGRLTGTMSYESHENPVWYNFQTVLLGMLPYTLIAVMSLWAVNWHHRRSTEYVGSRRLSLMARVRDTWRRILALDETTLFSLIATVSVFGFYCIPKSKRSVYLLPIYPFLSYFAVLLILWLVNGAKRSRKILIGYSRVILAVAVMLPVAYWTVKFLPIDSTNMAGSASMFIGGIKSFPVTFISVIFTIGIVYWGIIGWNKTKMDNPSYGASLPVLSTAAALIFVSSVILPPVLNAKSDRQFAMEVNRLAEKDAGIYIYLDTPMLRYYTIDFYLNDRMGRFEVEHPDEGWLVVGDRDFKTLQTNYEEQYTFAPVIVSDHKSCDTKQYLMLIRFTRCN